MELSSILQRTFADEFAVVAHVGRKSVRASDLLALFGVHWRKVRPTGGASFRLHLLSRTAKGFKSVACAPKPNRAASSGIEPPTKNGSKRWPTRRRRPHPSSKSCASYMRSNERHARAEIVSAEQRQTLRRELFVPILIALEPWLEALCSNSLPARKQSKPPALRLAPWKRPGLPPRACT